MNINININKKNNNCKHLFCFFIHFNSKTITNVQVFTCANEVQIPGQMRQYNIEIFSNDYELLTKHKFQQNKTFVMARKAI